jgi:hypothetical protein
MLGAACEAFEHKGGEECRLAVVGYAHPEVTP